MALRKFSILVLLAVPTLLGSEGCGRDFNLPDPIGGGGGDRFQFSNVSVEPPVLRAGVELTVVFGAEAALDRDSCKADLGGAPLICDAAFETRCTCRRTVGRPSERPEGEVVLFFEATSVQGSGRGSANLWVDNTPPSIEGSGLAIVRRPVGQNDVVSGLERSITEAGPDYPEAAVVEILLWDGEAASEPRVRISGGVPTADVELPNTRGLAGATLELSPASLWVSAVDVAGNVSPRTWITAGEDLGLPEIDPAAVQLTIPLAGASLAGGLSGRSDVITDLVSAPLRVELFADPAGLQALASAPVQSGSFAEVALGSRLTRVYLRALDKCGNASAVIEARRIEATIDPNTTAPGTLTFFDGSVAADPSTLSLVALKGSAVDQSASAALDAADTDRLISSIGPLVAVPATWNKASPTVAPTGFLGASMVWDPIRKQTVLLGDVGNGMETWIHDGSTWSLAAPTTTPPYRWEHAMAWHQGLGGVVLFGGFDNVNLLGDTWLWNGSNWTLLSPATSPPARRRHVMAHDPVRDVIVLFGGTVAAGPDLETWEFDGSTWSHLTTAVNPPWSDYASMSYHQARDEMILFGGGNRSQLTWVFSGGTWSRPQLVLEPSGRLRTAMAYDRSRQVLVLFGGDTALTSKSADTWELSSSGWIQASPALSPPGRLLHAMSYDVVRKRVMLTGGSLDPGGDASATWAYTPTASPGPRFAYQLFEFTLDAAVQPETFAATYVVAGRGDPDSDGTVNPGVTLYLRDAGGTRWVMLGSNTASDTDPVASRRLLGVVPGAVQSYANGGVITLLAVAPASSSPPGIVPSTLDGDHLQATVNYIRP